MPNVIFPEVTVPGSKFIREAERFLLGKHNTLARYDSVEDLVTDEKLPNNDLKAFQHHILVIRMAITKELWTKGVFIGVSVLDDFILAAASKGRPDICGKAVRMLKDARACQPGFVLYPLTEFGMRIPPIFRTSSTLKEYAVFSEAGFAVCSQANSFEAAMANIRLMADELGIEAPIEKDDVEHYSRGPMKWVLQNPLMMVRLASHTGDYYENQFIYTLKIRLASALVVMLHALSIDNGKDVATFETTAGVNNYETLDIRHYLIGEGRVKDGAPISLRRVPMNVGAMELARLSDLAVTLDTEVLDTEASKALQGRLIPVLKTVEDGYLKHVNLTSRDRVSNRVFRRLVTALDWYRHSFGSRTRETEAVVALAVAFETLLTDSYSPGVFNRIKRRLGICLAGIDGKADYIASVMSVFEARGEIVHNGDSDRQADIRKAQTAFAYCFEAVASRLLNLNKTSDNPIREMLGDIREDEPPPAA